MKRWRKTPTGIEYEKNFAPHRRKYRKLYYLRNKERIKKYSSDWDRLNPDKKKKYVENYRRNNKEKILLYHNIYQKRLYIKNKEKFKEYQKSYARTPTGKAVKLRSIHLRRTVQKVTDITYDWIVNIKKEQTICEICNLTMLPSGRYPNSVSIDHIVPLSLGGTHMKENIRLVCLGCNMKRPKKHLSVVNTILEPIS